MELSLLPKAQVCFLGNTEQGRIQKIQKGVTGTLNSCIQLDRIQRKKGRRPPRPTLKSAHTETKMTDFLFKANIVSRVSVEKQTLG